MRAVDLQGLIEDSTVKWSPNKKLSLKRGMDLIMMHMIIGVGDMFRVIFDTYFFERLFGYFSKTQTLNYNKYKS